MNYTDDQCRQLLAKMLPETVYLDAQNILCWPVYQQCGHPVLHTELLHIVLLVEAGLTWKQLLEYDRELEQKCWYADGESDDGRLSLILATWQQRTTALAEVKGVTL